MANNMDRIELTAERRATVREAIKTHPEWPRYREQYDTDMSQMTTKEAIGKCCDGLGIDIAEVIAATYVPIVPPAPAPSEEAAAEKPKRVRAAKPARGDPITVNLPDAPAAAIDQINTIVSAYVREAASALLSEAALREEIDRRLAEIETRGRELATQLLAQTYSGVIEELIAKGFRTALTNAARYFKSDED